MPPTDLGVFSQPCAPDRLDQLKPKLLVSVRNAAEANLARSHGVDWIDLKNPDAGSLGAASLSEAASVAQVLNGFSNRSAAVGELRDNPLKPAESLAQLFPILKVGLSGLVHNPSWRDELRQFSERLKSYPTQLVPVIYADHVLSNAPPPQAVLSIATELGCQLTLIDTYTKDGRRLFDWLSPKSIAATVEAARQTNIRIVVAGSLTLEDLPYLLELPIAAIAIRGAVCAQDRRSSLCETKLTQWVELFRNR